MKPIERSARTRTMCLMLAMLGGLALAKPAMAGQIGPLFACRTFQFGSIVRTNALQRQRLQVAHFSPRVGLFFFHVKSSGGAPSKKCLVPASIGQSVVQVNKNVQVVGQNNGILVMESKQENLFVGSETWFFSCPAPLAGAVFQKNVNVQIVGENNGILVMKSDQENIAVDSGKAASLVQLNVNVQVVGINDGVAVLSSKQSNTAA